MEYLGMLFINLENYHHIYIKEVIWKKKFSQQKK